MNAFLISSIILFSLMLSSCVSNPSKESPINSVAQDQNRVTKTPQLATVRKFEKKSIVPDIDEKGRRGEVARRMMAESTTRYLKADMNHDNLISVGEAGQHLPFVSKDFLRYDKNKDGSISWTEYTGHDKWPTPSHIKIKNKGLPVTLETGTHNPRTMGTTSP